MIPETRAMLAEALVSIGWDVHLFEPSNVELVPCLVVGRPSMEIHAQLYTITNPVWVIGRRLGDTDSAAELDTITDRAVTLLSSVASITLLTPGLRAIAESTYPAYRIDCVTGQGAC